MADIARDVATLREVFERVGRREPVDALLAPGFRMIGALIPTERVLPIESLDARVAGADAELDRWFIELRDVVPAPDRRLVAIFAAGTRRRGDGVGSASLIAAVYAFGDDNRITAGRAYATPPEAFAAAGLDPRTPYAADSGDGGGRPDD